MVELSYLNLYISGIVHDECVKWNNDFPEGSTS
jgi:hypothetical protein